MEGISTAIHEAVVGGLSAEDAGFEQGILKGLKREGVGFKEEDGDDGGASFGMRRGLLGFVAAEPVEHDGCPFLPE